MKNLQIVRRVCEWKNFDNRSIIGEDMDKSKVPRFPMDHGVYLARAAKRKKWINQPSMSMLPSPISKALF